MLSTRYSAFAPIGLRLNGDGQRGVVRSLTDAARILLQDWPSDDGEEYIIAVKACVDAITGTASTEVFRQALMRAASEAGIAAFSVVPETPLADIHAETRLATQ